MQFMAWSRDGNKIYYRRSEPKATRLMAHIVETGEEKELFRYHDHFFPANLAVSPDGRQLAFGSKGALLIMSAEGGEPRVVVPEPTETRLGPRGIAWGANGRFLYYFTEEQGGDNHPTHLFRVPMEGGQPENLGVRSEDARWLSVHPDGHRIVYSSQRYNAEVWVLENVR
ncbi:MAG: hypothetical protein M3Z85_15720, partial [Acidobacteriota bacterium]|nr:hypothetical protein [Acidobacteriota bacterium]